MSTSLYRRRLLGVVGGGLCSGIGGCLDVSSDTETTATESGRQATVVIRDGELSPDTLDVATGQELTVVFENDDNREHVLRGDFAEFEVRVPPGETASRTVALPEQPGTYAIDCTTSSDSVNFEAVSENLMGGCSLADDDE